MLGIEVGRIENEGIQALNDGTLVALQVVRTKGESQGRLLFLGLKP
jgi:hypothetical protein